ncbi:MAG: helix-turn-helix transcriptional regulator [Pseudanabaena sp. CRU_2_10]|nr:helix-turn-helix transcriptional regulator [Pseudanabaena sp. CRU_2_10]
MNTDKAHKFTDLIREQVLKSGSRNAFARELGVSNATLINWERGNTTPDRESLIRVANKTGYTINELLGMIDPSVEPPSVERILRELELLPREDIARVIRKATDMLIDG